MPHFILLMTFMYYGYAPIKYDFPSQRSCVEALNYFEKVYPESDGYCFEANGNKIREVIKGEK